MCILNLVNTGSATTTVTACSISAGGTAQPATPTAGARSLTVPAGGSDNGVLCTTNGNVVEPTAQNSEATDSIFLSNGAAVPFVGLWS